MIYKLFVLIFIVLMFLPIGLCEKFEDIKELNNIKIYDKNDKIISIYDKNESKSMDIKLISTILDIDKLIKIVEITNYIEYKPNKEKDFITKTKKIYGKNNIYKTEYFIEKYNYTFKNIIINKTIFNNKTGKNETKLINKTIIKDIKPFWVKFKPYNNKILKNEKFKLKIIHYKKPELGFFKIQTIPVFKNIECEEFTWWDGNWNLKRPILINNTYGDNVTNYSLKSVNLSQYQINATSSRFINESSGLQENFWNELIDSNGNLEYVWCNFSKINNGSWINETYYIYYQSNPNVNSVSNVSNTFINGWDFESDIIGNVPLDWTEDDANGDFHIITGKKVNLLHVNTDATPSNNYVSIKPIIEDNNRIIEFNFEININDEYNYIFISDNSIYLVNGIFLSIHNNNLYYNFDGWNLLTAISINTVYHIKIYNIDLTNNQFDIDVNAVNKGINLNFASTQSSLDYIHINGGGGENCNSEYDNIIIRKQTLNESELWTVGNIEYPEVLDMNCSLKVITHLTEKEIKIVNMTGDIVNISKSNECINLSYDSYILYMSNPVKISSFTELLNTIDNVFIQFFLFAFLIVIGIIFFTFLQIIKNKGFKGVTK